MLEMASAHKDALYASLANAAYDERYKYYFGGGWVTLQPEIKPDTWDRVQCVSVDRRGVVHGFLEAVVLQKMHSIDPLLAIHFGTDSFPFVRDFHAFLSKLFEQLRMHKVVWSVIAGNPAQRMYTRIAAKYGGRIVGTFTDNAITWDGIRRDQIFYEITLAQYLGSKRSRTWSG